MSKFLRQPTWHRIFKEIQADWLIKNLSVNQLLLRSRSGDRGSYRVGIVGLGRVARRHVYGYLKTGNCLLVAGSDPSPKQRRIAMKRYQMQSTYEDYEKLFSEQHGKLDVISVCAPPRFHRDIVIRAARSGVRAILCEKPLGLDLREADEMIRICREENVVLLTGHQRRYSAQHVLAKRLLSQNTLGRVHFVCAECPRDILRAGIHAADMLQDYLGPLQSVMACLNNGRGAPAKNTEQACLTSEAGDKQSGIYLEFKNGTRGFMRVADRSGLDARLYFLCEQGEIELWWDGGVRYRKTHDACWTIPDLQINPYFEEFYLEIQAMINSLDGKTTSLIRGEDGRNSLEVILAILQSNEQCRPVALPLQGYGEDLKVARKN